MMLIFVAGEERLWFAFWNADSQEIGLKTETRFEKGRVFFGFYDTARTPTTCVGLRYAI